MRINSQNNKLAGKSLEVQMKNNNNLLDASLKRLINNYKSFNLRYLKRFIKADRIKSIRRFTS